MNNNLGLSSHPLNPGSKEYPNLGAKKIPVNIDRDFYALIQRIISSRFS